MKSNKFSYEIKEILNRNELLTRMCRDAGVKSSIAEKLIQKENDSPSLIGHYTALPHLESDEIGSTTIIFAHLENGIQWGQRPMDTARAVLIIITPHRSSLRELMSKVALLLLNEPRGVPFTGSDLKEI